MIRATQKAIYGLCVGFARYVPKRLVDPADSRIHGNILPPPVMPEQRLPNLLDPGWVLTDQEWGHEIDTLDDRGLMPLHCGLSPSVNPFIGFDFHESPVSIGNSHDKGLDC